MYRAEKLDQWMHAALASSLSHVAERCTASAPKISDLLAIPIAHIRDGGRLPPEAFATYYELVEAASSGEIEDAVRHAHRIGNVLLSPDRREWPVLAVGSQEAASLETAFKGRMGLHERSLFGVVDETTRKDFATRLDAGLSLLELGMPDIHAEITTIIRAVLLAQAPAEAELEFDGASHFELWGLVLLNPRFHQTRLEVAEVLAHECGHSLLFGMMGKELLVHNPYEDKYPSPLRPDPRPMDGIFHATFVSARMALTMEGLAASGVLTSEECENALTAADRDRSNFASGDSVIKEHGRLTPTGLKIIENARQWISQPPVITR